MSLRKEASRRDAAPPKGRRSRRDAAPTKNRRRSRRDAVPTKSRRRSRWDPAPTKGNGLGTAVAAFLLVAAWAGTAAAQAPVETAAALPEFNTESNRPEAESFRTLDEEVQDLKKLAVDLNRDLFLLEEELLYPASTQVAVFVSMDVGEFFGLDSIELQLDGDDVTNYLYTEREVDALHRGGVQRLYIGNLRAGEHELVAIFTGAGPHDRDYRRGASHVFEKGIGPKYIELTITDREVRMQPEFDVREWE